MFDNVEFPLTVATFSSTIQYQTTILVGDNASEDRNVDWDDPLLSFDAATGVKSDTDLLILIKFFRARKGRARGFLVKDWSDYKATNESIGTRTGTGAQTHQLIKTYTDSGKTEIREIYKPKSGTVTIYANSNPLVENTDYTINYTTGVLTILAGRVTAGHVLTWTGQFNVPVRFLEDKLKTEMILYKLTTGLGEAVCPLVETRDIS